MTTHTASRPLTADALKRAAVDAMSAPFDPATGRRVGDRLLDLIPGDGEATAEVLALVRNVTGRVITNRQSEFLHTAPAARAALRRWAVLNRES